MKADPEKLARLVRRIAAETALYVTFAKKNVASIQMLAVCCSLGKCSLERPREDGPYMSAISDRGSWALGDRRAYAVIGLSRLGDENLQAILADVESIEVEDTHFGTPVFNDHRKWGGALIRLVIDSQNVVETFEGFGFGISADCIVDPEGIPCLEFKLFVDTECVDTIIFDTWSGSATVNGKAPIFCGHAKQIAALLVSTMHTRVELI